MIVQVPAPVSETVDPDTVHTPALPAAIVKVTVSPELAVALTLYGDPPMLAPDGTLDVKSIDCVLADGAAIANDCCTCAATLYAPLPAWSALIVHVPASTNATVAPVTVQMPALLGAAANVTVRPDVAVADTVYAGSPMSAFEGGGELKLIACDARPTLNDCCTCGAGW